MNSIAFLIPTLSQYGGAERQTSLLAQGLTERGWRTTILTLAQSGTDEFEPGIQGIDRVHLAMRKGLADPRGWIRLCAWLNRNTPDIVHAHLPHATWMARWSRIAAPARVVVDTIHTSGTGTQGRRRGYQWSNWLTNQVTAVSRGAADAWINARMVSADKLTILPNGIDTEFWKPSLGVRAEIRRQFGISDDFLWLAAGRLEPVKDFPTLLRAFAQLPIRSRLVLAGCGSQERELRSLAESLSLTSRVHFLGFEPNLLRWMQAADAFVLSSRWEGLPMCLLEAGACNLPCVATNIAGASEIIADSRNGFLARANDPDSLATCMTRLMDLSDERRQEMGNTARQIVETRYSLPSILDQWEQLYLHLLANHPHASRTGGTRISRSRWTARISVYDGGADARVQPLERTPRAR